MMRESRVVLSSRRQLTLSPNWLSIVLIGFFAALFSQDGAAACYREALPFGPDYADEYHRSSVFPLIVSGGDEIDVLLGTAYLVDARGYLLTAGHNVYSELDSPENVRQAAGARRIYAIKELGDGDQLRMPLRVISPKEYRDEYDIAVLQMLVDEVVTSDGTVVPENDVETLLDRPVPLVMEVPESGEKGQVAGYMVDQNDGNRRFVWELANFALRRSGRRNNLSFLYEGEVFNGHSGSPMIDDLGYSIGTVTNHLVPQKKESEFAQAGEDLQRRRFTATHHYEIPGICAMVPVPKKVSLILDRLDAPTLSAVDREIITRNRLSGMEWIGLTEQMKQEMGKFKSHLDTYTWLQEYIREEAEQECVGMKLVMDWAAALTNGGVRIAGDPLQLMQTAYLAFTEQIEIGAPERVIKEAYNSVDSIYANVGVPAVLAVSDEKYRFDLSGSLYKEWLEMSNSARIHRPDLVQLANAYGSNNPEMARLIAGNAQLRGWSGGFPPDREVFLSKLQERRRAAMAQKYQETVQMEREWQQRTAMEAAVNRAMEREWQQRRAEQAMRPRQIHQESVAPHGYHRSPYGDYGYSAGGPAYGYGGARPAPPPSPYGYGSGSAAHPGDYQAPTTPSTGAP